MPDKQKRIKRMRDRLTEKSNRIEQKGIEAGAKGNYKKRNRKFDRADDIDTKRGEKTKKALAMGKVYMMDKDKKKKFKPHNMYCKDGSKHFAKTYQQHLKLDKKGCGHKPMKKK